MNVLPTFFDLSGRNVVIAGGGETAARKARLIIAAGARPEFISEQLSAALQAEFEHSGRFRNCKVTTADLVGVTLVIVAEDNPGQQEAIADLVRRAGIPVNVVDRPDLSDFIIPSIVDRGDVVVGISTNGTAPVFGRRLREKIENWLPRRTGALTAFAKSFRGMVSLKIPPQDRRTFWENFFDGPIAASILHGNDQQARSKMEAAIDNVRSPQCGSVHIIGAGPGDPELLTIRAHRILQTADVILYDRLVGDEILNFARRDATRLYVGKAKGNHAVPQEKIEEAIIKYARDGKIVVRLKGGDPFVFGRGGEELETVRRAGIDVCVTPGITAATGCAAAAGMPLTHRNFAQAVTFVTGHAKENTEPDLNWQALADLRHTLVVYMGVGNAPIISEKLVSHGRAADTPVAVIENGTCKNEIIAKGTLGDLATIISDAGIKGPALLVIGEVALLATERDLRTFVDKERRAA